MSGGLQGTHVDEGIQQINRKGQSLTEHNINQPKVILINKT